MTKSVLFKIQDKNRRVEGPAKETLETFFKFSYSINEVSEHYLNALKTKSPTLITRTMQVIERYFLFCIDDI